MAAWTTQFALLVDQLMPALRTPPPMLAGNVFVRRRGTGFILFFVHLFLEMLFELNQALATVEKIEGRGLDAF